MSTLCPTLSEANTAFNAKMALALAALVTSGDVVITPANSDNTPDLSKILAISAFQPDRTTGAEMGGPGALAVRSGVYLVTLSAPKTISQKRHWDAAQVVEDYFAQFSASPLTVASGAQIYCDQPYTMNAGITPDKRISLLVTVPWHTWASN